MKCVKNLTSSLLLINVVDPITSTILSEELEPDKLYELKNDAYIINAEALIKDGILCVG